MKKPPRLNAFEVLQWRRQRVAPEALRAIGKARRIEEARLRSGWDSYVKYDARRVAGAWHKQSTGAIAAARAGNVNRLVDCLRACKPMTDEDREELKAYITTKFRSRLWSSDLHLALTRAPTTEEDFDLLADLVEKQERKRGGTRDDAAHRVAREVRVLLSVLCPSGRAPKNLRDKVIEISLALEADESGLTIDVERRDDERLKERVLNILSHPKRRDHTR